MILGCGKLSMGYYDDYLEHHGILGQKWGVRRFQRPDGTLTSAGQRRYDKMESYKKKLSNKAARESVNYKAKAKQTEYELDDLKKNGFNSNTYKLHEKEQQLKDVETYGKGSGHTFANQITRGLFADMELKELIDSKNKEYERCTYLANSWMKTHDDVMNMPVSVLTKKRDIRREYIRSRVEG